MANPDLAQEATALLHGAASLLRGASELPGESSALLSEASEPSREASEPSREASQLPHETSPRAGADASAPEALVELVRLAASGVAGCSGASATLWRNGEPAVFAASHPDLAELATIEQTSGSGPMTAAVASGAPVWSADTLGEERWPGYAAAALARGVRCSGTLVHHSGRVTVTLSLFGARPGQPCPQDQPLRRLAAVFGSAAPGQTAGLEARPPGSICS